MIVDRERRWTVMLDDIHGGGNCEISPRGCPFLFKPVIATEANEMRYEKRLVGCTTEALNRTNEDGPSA